MTSLTAWMINLTLSLCVIILAAGANSSTLHMAASGAVSLVFALLAVREHAALTAANATKSVIGASTARYSGLLWAWGALGMLVSYLFVPFLQVGGKLIKTVPAFFVRLAWQDAAWFYVALGFNVLGEVDVSLAPGIHFPAVHMQRRET